ncbi:MAG: endonuclease/exonuclease/phosphatase family protein [Pseudomonadota bacterium]|nr:endonuclease/exonuclease/phosphatase family protein [Pseudomonadota bacterium]
MTERLRIASFNLENLDDGPGNEALFAERVGILRSQLARLDADILCLQEVNSQRTDPKIRRKRSLRALKKLLVGTSYESFEIAAVGGVHLNSIADRHNLVIASRFPIWEYRSIRHENVSPPLYTLATANPGASRNEPVEWDRPVLYAAIVLPDKRLLHIFNVHFRAPLAAHVSGQKVKPMVWKTVSGWAEGFFMASVKQAGQALEVRMAIEKIFDRQSDALIVAVGDFNADDRYMPTRIVTADPEDTGNGLLAPRMMVPLERTLPEHQRFSVLHAGTAMMLDHLLVSRPLLAYYRSIEVHNEALGDEVTARNIHPASPESYHAPLVAEFVVPD